MKLSSKNISLTLRTFQKRRQILLEAMMGSEPLIIGTVYDVLRRCGNPYCHCADKPGHRQTLLLYIEKGRRYCRFVRQKDVEWVRKAWKRYKESKGALREIRTLNQRELQLLKVQMRSRGVHYK